MCDSATATVLTSGSNNLQSCWIVYTNNQGIQRVVVTNTNAASCSKQTIESSNSKTTTSTSGDSTIDIKSLNNILDEHLRPIPPVPNNPLSEQIYGEHKKLVTEYFEVQEQIGYSIKNKEKLLAEMSPEERALKLVYLNKLKEKEELLKLHASLKKQLGQKNPKRSQQQQQQHHQMHHSPHPQQSAPPPPQMSRQDSTGDGGWVIVQNENNNNTNTKNTK